MYSASSLRLVCAAAFSLAALAGSAQTPGGGADAMAHGAGPVNAAAAIAGQSHTVVLDVAVDAKKNGQAAPPLNRSDFTVIDNGKPRELRSFRAIEAGQEPIRVVLVIDQLNIELRGLDNEEQQVVRFLRSHSGPLPVPTALGILTEKGLKVQPAYSTDGAQLAATLQKLGVSLRALTRGSGFYGAEERLDDSLNALGGLVEQEKPLPGRTIIFWVSPGWPVLSGPEVMLSSQQQQGIYKSIVGLTDAMRASRITLYAINPVGTVENLEHEFAYEQYVKGASKPSQAVFGDLALQTLAVQSGGDALNSNDTGALLQKSYDDLKHYYELSYEIREDERPNEYHQVQVEVPDRALSAHARTVYYTAP